MLIALRNPPSSKFPHIPCGHQVILGSHPVPWSAAWCKSGHGLASPWHAQAVEAHFVCPSVASQAKAAACQSAGAGLIMSRILPRLGQLARIALSKSVQAGNRSYNSVGGRYS